MRRELKRLIRKLGLASGLVKPSAHEAAVQKLTQVITCQPRGTNGQPMGRVLVSYVIDPFLDPTQPISNSHTHYWESFAIVQAFLERGFVVDVIHFENRTFQPTHDYQICLSARTNLDVLRPRLNKSCLCVVHLDTAHWLFNNTAAYQRLSDLRQRKGVILHNPKTVEPNWALENADMGTVLGNQFTIDTYRYANKPLFRIPISAPLEYPWNSQKDFAACRQNYLWFGSSGFVHKGLDLVLDAFKEMPDKTLYVCGPFDQENRFVKAYANELYDTHNIKAVGWIDVASQEFRDLTAKCAALVYPTCSEGGGGGVITAMHAGLVPIVTEQASVDVGEGGVTLQSASIDEICQQVEHVASLTSEELEVKSRQSWEQARAVHTREKFAEHFASFVESELLPRLQKNA